MMRRMIMAVFISGLAIATVSACGGDEKTPTAAPATSTPGPATTTKAPANIQVAFSEKTRVVSREIPAADLNELRSGNTRFALALYGQLAQEDGNLFMSPHSISVALAMTYAGARGDTAAEMATALGFTLDNDRLHPAFNALDQTLAARGQDQPPDQKFTLEVINQLWGQQGFEFKGDFLDTLAENYGAGMRLVDYVSASEAARQTINDWVTDNTNDRIKDLIPQGVINGLTRLVLTNAIFFKASWQEEFDESATVDGDFHLANGGTSRVPLMRREGEYRYAAGDGYQALEMPYVGGQTSMVVLLPADGRFEEFESRLDSELLNQIIGGLNRSVVDVTFPRFEFESEFKLKPVLRSMGMEKAFQEGEADFSGMRDIPPRLLIEDVLHKSFVSVDEQGTEAAAATAVVIRVESMPAGPFEFTADRPFIFLIRDIPTGTVLFMGRLQDPSA